MKNHDDFTSRKLASVRYEIFRCIGCTLACTNVGINLLMILHSLKCRPFLFIGGLPHVWLWPLRKKICDNLGYSNIWLYFWYSYFDSISVSAWWWRSRITHVGVFSFQNSRSKLNMFLAISITWSIFILWEKIKTTHVRVSASLKNWKCSSIRSLVLV